MKVKKEDNYSLYRRLDHYRENDTLQADVEFNCPFCNIKNVPFCITLSEDGEKMKLEISCENCNNVLRRTFFTYKYFKENCKNQDFKWDW